MREGFFEVDKGTRLWFRVQGDGPALAFQNGVGVTITFWEALAGKLARLGWKTILWDYRGHGRSDEPRDVEGLDLPVLAHDLRALLDSLGVDKACLLGHSMGSQLGFEFHRLYPERVAGLVPTLGTYRRATDSFYGHPVASRAILRATTRLAFTSPSIIRRTTRLGAEQPGLTEFLARQLGIVHPKLSPKGWLPGYLQHTARLDPRVFFRLANAIAEHDATEQLPRIEVPVLVIAGERDFFCAPGVAKEMAAKIPGAELLVVPSGSHAAIIEQPELVELRIERFLEERVFPKAQAPAA